MKDLIVIVAGLLMMAALVFGSASAAAAKPTIGWEQAQQVYAEGFKDATAYLGPMTDGDLLSVFISTQPKCKFLVYRLDNDQQLWGVEESYHLGQCAAMYKIARSRNLVNHS